jgi:hypothetical protein
MVRPVGPCPVAMKRFSAPGAAQDRQAVGRRWPEADAHVAQRPGGQTGGDGEGLTEDLMHAAGCLPVVEPRVVLARRAGDDAVAGEGQQVVALERQDHGPLARVVAGHRQVRDLPPLRKDRQRQADLRAEGRRPGPGGDDHPFGRCWPAIDERVNGSAPIAA